MLTYYDILEVAPHCSPEVIKNAYRALAKKYHPDLELNESAKQWSESAFRTITEAYEVLSNIEKRKNYDLWLNVNSSQKEVVSPEAKVKETKTIKASIKNAMGKVLLAALILVGISSFVDLVVTYHTGIIKSAQAMLIALSLSGILAFVLLVVNISNAILKKILKASVIGIIAFALLTFLVIFQQLKTANSDTGSYNKDLKVVGISIENTTTGNEIVGRVKNNSTSTTYSYFVIECNVYDKDNSILQTVDISITEKVPPVKCRFDYGGFSYSSLHQIDSHAVSVKPIEIKALT